MNVFGVVITVTPMQCALMFLEVLTAPATKDTLEMGSSVQVSLYIGYQENKICDAIVTFRS